MPHAAFVVPGRLDTRTGGYIYDRRIIEGLRGLGWVVDVLEIDGSFPRPAGAALADASQALRTIPSGTTVVMDGLAFGSMPDLVTREASRQRIVGLVHLPLAADVSLDRETASRVEDGEGRALRAATRVIVTGEATRGLLARYGLPHDRIRVVEPGTDAALPARGSASDTVHLLCVATLNAGKGHEELLAALAAIRALRWRLTCAGSLTRDPPTAARVREALRRLELDDRVALEGDLDASALAAAYDAADLFVLATRQETYGMAVAEALAHGLPVVSTATGAIPRLVGNDAGVVVPAGDAAALTGALARTIGDREYRLCLAAGAARARARLSTWEQASARFAAALEAR